MSVNCEALAVASCNISTKSLWVFSSSFFSWIWSSLWAFFCWSTVRLKVSRAIWVRKGYFYVFYLFLYGSCDAKFLAGQGTGKVESVFQATIVHYYNLSISNIQKIYQFTYFSLNPQFVYFSLNLRSPLWISSKFSLAVWQCSSSPFLLRITSSLKL